jgi:C4-dicarboxylate-specific signal transduction histidine kinase
MDVLMPRVDGLEACRRIKETHGPDLPVVFMTGTEDRELRVRCKAAGADEFLLKPVDRFELLARVSTLLEVKAYHDLQRRQHELLEQELERTREQLLHADRLATLGTLAAGVGHEVKNLLHVLRSAGDFIEAAARQGRPPDPEDLALLRQGLAGLETHAGHLLRLGRPAAEEVRREDLRDVVARTLETLHTIGKTKYVQVAAEYAPGELPVKASRVRLEQVLVNLVGNAVDAFADRRRPDARLRVTALRRGPDAACCVADNAGGLSAEARRRLFEPYFTTKAAGKGNGLGLVVVKDIVSSHGGRLEVESVEGEGTSFTFTLPLDDAPA